MVEEGTDEASAEIRANAEGGTKGELGCQVTVVVRMAEVTRF